MGGFVKDVAAGDAFYEWNSRFRNDGPLQEMVAIQKEFGLFSGKYTLRQAFRLLNIVPREFSERKGWLTFLDYLKRYPSDVDGVNGHDRIVRVYSEDLESRAPLPVFTTTHLLADDKRVRVTRGKPIAHEDQEYIVISIPTKPVMRAKPRGSARKKR